MVNRGNTLELVTTEEFAMKYVGALRHNNRDSDARTTVILPPRQDLRNADTD